MYNRKKLDHERLELILVQILMKVRLIILVLGILLFLYALAIMLNSLMPGYCCTCILSANNPLTQLET